MYLLLPSFQQDILSSFKGNMEVIDMSFLSMQLNLTAGEEVVIEYEVDGWFYVSVQKE